MVYSLNIFSNLQVEGSNPPGRARNLTVANAAVLIFCFYGKFVVLFRDVCRNVFFSSWDCWAGILFDFPPG